jgi:hypothetical protein
MINAMLGYREMANWARSHYREGISSESVPSGTEHQV